MKKKFCFVLVLFFVSVSIWAQDVFSWDFSDCEIKDILFAVSLDTGISICCDDTVSGKADFKFAGLDFGSAFDAFLCGNRLYVEKTDERWTVSRFRFVTNGELFCVDAFDLPMAVILEKVSVGLGKPLTYDALSNGKISLHFKDLSEEELMNCLCKRCGSYRVEKTEWGYDFEKFVQQKKIEGSEEFAKIDWNENRVFVDVKNFSFFDAVEAFFGSEVQKRNFCFAAKEDFKVGRTVFEAEDFDEALRKLCNQNGYEFLVKDKVYYIFSDSEAKENLIFGQKKWVCFNLKYSSPEEIISILVKRFGRFENFCGSGFDYFFAKVSEEEKAAFEELIGELDVKKVLRVVNLKYIRPSVLLKYLPPGFDRSQLVLADDESALYFKGTEAAYEELCSQIEVCDRPVKRISYDLLILQYDDSLENSWTNNFSLKGLNMGDRTSLSGILGSVLNLNFNVVAAFGLDFATSLQASIEENHTKVFADTTLHGVNGKEIKFQSTNTYRYRDNNLDPDTGKPVYSGVTREIVSGIKLEVVPWISGDGMITSTVTASVSRQGSDTSSTTGNPPPTTEKLLTTEVSGRSGEPVVLTGLFSEAETESVEGLPWIYKVKFLRKLFGSDSKSEEKNRMVIILIPRAEAEDELDGNLPVVGGEKAPVAGDFLELDGILSETGGEKEEK